MVAEAELDPETILLIRQSEQASLKKAYQDHRRLEYGQVISYAVRLREYMRLSVKSRGLSTPSRERPWIA